jgi:Photosynthesis system II assembly factor YCF48
MRRLALVGLSVLAVAGCGSNTVPPTPDLKKSDRLVDLAAKPPLVNALDIDPGSGEFLLTTNRGFFRIDPKTKKVTEVTGTISAGTKSSTVGTFLFLLATGPNELIGSGHPDDKALPQFLGFIKSSDGGKSWTILSRLGEADLHKIILVGDKLFAFDAVLGAMLVSTDGGKTFTEKFTPRGLIIDFVVDPNDENHLLAANEEQLFRSEDGGDSWRPLSSEPGTRMAWPTDPTLYKATQDGAFSVSADGGSTFKDVSKLPGEPYKIKALDAQHLYVALSDGTIMETTDGGKSFKEAFRP